MNTKLIMQIYVTAVMALCLTVASCGGSDMSIENGEVFNPEDVDSAGSTQDMPTIKIIKVENPAQVAARGNLVFKLYCATYQLEFYRSMDGGATFEGLQLPEGMGCISPIYLTRNETLLLTRLDAIEETDIVTDTETEIYRSVDNGDTFTVEVLPTREDNIVDQDFWRKSRVGKMRSGGILAWFGGQNDGTPIYLLEGGPDNKIRFSKSTDDGLTFSETYTFPSYYGNNYPSNKLIAAADGDNFLLIPNVEGDLASSNDATQTFRKIQDGLLLRQSDGIYISSDIAIEGQNVYVVGVKDIYNDRTIDRCYLFKSVDGGQTFSEPQLIASLSGGNAKWLVDDLLVHGENIYVLFSAGGAEINGTIVPIHIITSQDGGATFSEPQRITDTESHLQWSSSVIDEEGNLFIFWTDKSMYEYWD